jgi:hypothetical protein
MSARKLPRPLRRSFYATFESTQEQRGGGCTNLKPHRGRDPLGERRLRDTHALTQRSEVTKTPKAFVAFKNAG